MMQVYIIIPVYNEEKYLEKTLESLVNQIYLPKKICIVDDNSTDATPIIIEKFTSKYEWISTIKTNATHQHLPGAKVVNSFLYGLQSLDENYDLLCKFDADLIFPKNYLEDIVKAFYQNINLGMAGGFCYIQKNGKWVLENLTASDHIRGALKCYRQACYKEIGGLIPAMGWDTLDEMLALYNNWEIRTFPDLQVKHLKPTGRDYHKKSKFNQGIAFYQMRYRPLLTFLATLKLAVKRKSLKYFINTIRGYFRAYVGRKPFLINKEQGAFIRGLRWKNIMHKYLNLKKLK